jgi:chlorobactene glucosyltransferase
MAANIALVIYVVLGPVAWGGLVFGFYLGRARLGRLVARHSELPEIAPHATIVIPAKDESAGIRNCIRAVLQQDYPSFSVLVVDDRSSDDTGRILDWLISENPAKLQVLHIDHLPEGWLGKCHALHQATRKIKSSWLLFVDSDVTLQPNALREAVAIAAARKYDAVSILTRIDGRTFWERLMIPLCAATWAVIFLVSYTNEDSYPGIAAANGQFFLIRRDAYEAVGGHAAVKNQIVEDVELMRLLKRRGYTVRLFAGSHLAATRMHATLAQLRSGWGRIYAGTSRFKPARLIATILFVALCGLGVYPAILHGILARDPKWLAASLLHFAMINWYLIHVYRAAGLSIRYALAFPLSGAVLVQLLAIAVQKCRNRNFEWRGTKVVAASSNR